VVPERRRTNFRAEHYAGLAAYCLGGRLPGHEEEAEPFLNQTARAMLDPMVPEPDTEIRDLSVEEGEQLLDEQARRYLGMTGEEFARQWAAAQIEADTAPEVMRVAMLLPLAGR
jgi:hypothetical protein